MGYEKAKVMECGQTLASLPCMAGSLWWHSTMGKHRDPEDPYFIHSRAEGSIAIRFVSETRFMAEQNQFQTSCFRTQEWLVH